MLITIDFLKIKTNIFLIVYSITEYLFEDKPENAQLESQMRGDGPPVVLAITKNFSVLVKLVKCK